MRRRSARDSREWTGLGEGKEREEGEWGGGRNGEG